MKTIKAIGTVLALVAGMAIAQANQEKQADHQDHKGEKMAAEKGGDAKVIANQLPSYPLATCPVSGEALAGMEDAQNVVVDGHLVRVCCKSCVRKVEADPKKYIGLVEAAVIKEQTPGYPMTTCPLTGEELGSMGEPIQLVHGTRLVQLCCKGCVKGFMKNPAKTMEKLDAALIAKQLKTYKLKTCVVSGEELEAGKAVDFLYGTKLVRVCCKSCVKAVKKDPAKHLAKL